MKFSPQVYELVIRLRQKAQETFNPFAGPDKRYGGGQRKEKRKKKKKVY